MVDAIVVKLALLQRHAGTGDARKREDRQKLHFVCVTARDADIFNSIIMLNEHTCVTPKAHGQAT
jgi:hypothetical protein